MVSGKGLGEWLGLPTDVRGAVLAAGSLVLVLYGLALILGGDLLGLAWLAAGIVSYAFLHGRLVPAVTGLAVALAGLLAAATNLAGLIPFLAGLALAGVAFWRPTFSDTGVGTVGIDQTEPPAGAREPVEERRVTSSLVVDAIPEQAPVSVQERATPEVATGVRIETIGRFRILVDGKDATLELARKRTLQFGWKFLLVRALAGHGPISAEDFGDELSPGLPLRTQKRRARQQIWDLLNDLSKPLGSVLGKDGQDLFFNLKACAVDVVDLRAMAPRVSQVGGLLPDELAVAGAGLLASSAGDVLPEFDAQIKQFNQGRGTAGDNLREVRLEVDDLRADIACALADRHAATGDAKAVIRVLEPVAKRSPREDVLERLTSAYIRTGQTARANQLRRPVDAAQEV